MAANNRAIKASKPPKPHSRLMFCFTTTSITMATRNTVATSFYNRSCWLLSAKTSRCCCAYSTCKLMW